MIEFQDQIELAPERLTEIQQRFQDDYLPAAASQRGMTLLETRVSPPLKLSNGSITLWYRWQVADVQSWWAMRAQAGTPEVTQFWQDIDKIALFRERIYFSAPFPKELAESQSTAAFEIATRGHRETAQLKLKRSLGGEDKGRFVSALQQSEKLPDLEAFSFEQNLAPDYAAGDFTFDLLFADATSADQARQSALWLNTIAPAIAQYCEACHVLGMNTLGAGLREPGLKNAIKRTAYFRLLPGTDDSTARRFEQDLLEMPMQIPEILNWRLSRAEALPWNQSDVAPWTYVWEQEFAKLEDLLGPYMTHPHHWAHIDRWFDPESGIQAVDTRLSHAFSPLQESLIAKESQRTPISSP